MSIQIRIFVPSFDKFHALLLEWTVRTIRATNKYIHPDSLMPFFLYLNLIMKFKYESSYETLLNFYKILVLRNTIYFLKQVPVSCYNLMH